MFQRPVDQTGVAAMSPEQLEALRGQPLSRPMARYAVLEPREVSELAAQLPSVSMGKLNRCLELDFEVRST